ncbi:uncharacterized protein LOC127855014 [Dreissena polymorpha]|uniref:uncharacterized protein LOC127855014 n=1 Tax=Dreissena polymorpha TaxID=45954 RepID=UPI0022640F66|nr:uncharacterized protein LOC127855014 [Dreissena polymorpha]
MQTRPMILSGTRLNVNFAPITTLESVTVAFQNRDEDFPFYISMEFHAQKAKLDVKINGTWQRLYVYDGKNEQAFTASVTSQHTVTLDVDQTGLTQIYLDGVAITDYRHPLMDVTRSNNLYVGSSSDNVMLTRLEFKRLR